MNVELKPITLEQYEMFFKQKPHRTIRGYSFFLDGEIVAVFGALLDQGSTMLFSDVKEGLNAPAITIWRWSKRALKLIDDMGQPLYATSKNAEKFLLSLGFVFHTNTKYGKLYVYRG